MTTKAERARVEAQRDANPPKPKRPPRRRRDVPVDTAQPGTSATDRKAGDGVSTATRNVSQRAAKKATAALEGSARGRPSRKSTRGSANRAKAAAKLQRRETRKAHAPSARARKAGAARTGAAKKKTPKAKVPRRARPAPVR